MSLYKIESSTQYLSVHWSQWSVTQFMYRLTYGSTFIFYKLLTNKLLIWRFTKMPPRGKFHWQPCLRYSFWKVGQMLRSQHQITCFIIVVTSRKMIISHGKVLSLRTVIWNIPNIYYSKVLAKVEVFDIQQRTVIWNIPNIYYSKVLAKVEVFDIQQNQTLRQGHNVISASTHGKVLSNRYSRG
jgi:hypothetical protein